MLFKRYGAYLLLLRLYNEAPMHSTDKVLAQYFLKRFSQMRDVNIYDVAVDCKVSRATVRRFFAKLSFDSFLDFKNEFIAPYDFSMFEIELRRENYAQEHLRQVSQVPAFFQNNELEILDKTKRLAKIMFDSENIFWFTSMSTTRMAEDMQMQFLQLECLWDIVINYSQNMGLPIQGEDVVIVLSISAVMADAIIEELRSIRAPIYLVTLNKSYQNDVFTEIICLCNEELYDFTAPKSDDAVKQEVVYRKYATNLFFDFLYYEYTMLYEKD